MLNIYIRDYEWAQSKERSIDDNTLCDLLRIIEYEAKRSSKLEEIGIEDKAAPYDALFDYVLDALGVPAETENTKNDFSKEWFEEQFYSEFLLSNEQHNWSHIDLINIFRAEVKHRLQYHYRSTT